jgi:hypothetical protein
VTPAARLLNTTKQPEPEPEAPVFNTTKNEPKPRSADRYLEPNRDRHSPGYSCISVFHLVPVSAGPVARATIVRPRG